MIHKTLVIIALVVMVTIVMATGETAPATNVYETSGSRSTIESTSWKLFLHERALPESCINRYREEDQPTVASV